MRVEQRLNLARDPIRFVPQALHADALCRRRVTSRADPLQHQRLDLTSERAPPCVQLAHSGHVSHLGMLNRAQMGLSRFDAQRVMEALLGVVPETEFRLVGTASCLLRGIDVAANDIDVLFRQRDTVDAWVASAAHLAAVHDAPRWLPDAAQYFARLDIDGVTVELSTVEIDAPTDTFECAGSGPWAHFDEVRCGEFGIRAVALELRLATDVARGRADRCEPIIGYLRAHPCDLALVERALVAHSIPAGEIAVIMRSLTVG